MQKKRYYKARPVVQKVQDEKGQVYDSELELKLHQSSLAGFEKHPCKIPYVSFHEYNPDFILETPVGRLIIEVKGFFQDTAEARKYKDIREALPDCDELVFIFERPYSKLPWAKRRKGGTFLTHEEWARTNGFRAYGPSNSRQEIVGKYDECTRED